MLCAVGDFFSISNDVFTTGKFFHINGKILHNRTWAVSIENEGKIRKAEKETLGDSRRRGDGGTNPELRLGCHTSWQTPEMDGQSEEHHQPYAGQPVPHVVVVG
jgi:hypothetical protein